MGLHSVYSGILKLVVCVIRGSIARIIIKCQGGRVLDGWQAAKVVTMFRGKVGLG